MSYGVVKYLIHLGNDLAEKKKNFVVSIKCPYGRDNWDFTTSEFITLISDHNITDLIMLRWMKILNSQTV